MNGVKRLPLKTMEEWKSKAKAVDAALQYLEGLDLCERCMTVKAILTGVEKQEETSA